MIYLDFKQFYEDNSLKSRNLKEIYRLIHQNGPIKRTDLLPLTNHPQTTLVRMIDELLQAGFIYESGMEKSSGGRPPILYQIVSDCSYIIGIDISRTHTTIGFIDIAFNLIDKVSFTMTKEYTPEHTIAKIIETIKLFIGKYQLGIDDILGIGIGSVGPLDREQGMILTAESFLATGWDHVPIVEEIIKEFRVHTILENGANTAALGEYYQSPLMNQNILYCISGLGLRCGTLANGQIVKNKIGDASSFGHMIIDIDGKACNCGNKGCLLSYISLNNIADKIMHRIDHGEKSIMSEWVNHDRDQITLEKIIQAGKRNDDLVHQIVLETAYYFGIGIANMINLTHPEHVILNGKLIYEYPTYFEKVINTAEKHIFRPKGTVAFSKGILKENAVVIGAAALLFDSF